MLNLGNFVQSLLFAEHCASCDKLITEREYAGRALCESCFRALASGRPSVEVHPLDEYTTLTVFSAVPYDEKMKKLLYKFKYDGELLIGVDLSEFIIASWNGAARQFGSTGNWLICPIPLHWTRYFKRGFNQSNFLAQRLSWRENIPMCTAALKRVKRTKAQHNLGRFERAKNMSSAFKGNISLVAGNNFILIDDIYTSGATLREAASELYNCGATRVCAITLARAQLNESAPMSLV